jgi:hypothetical protein
MTASPRAVLPEMDLVLPGTWWAVELSGDDDAVTRSVRQMVERVLGVHDGLARQRAELRARLREVVDAAREGHAANLYIAMELTERLSLAVYWPPDPVLGSLPSTPSSVIDLVRVGLEAQPSSAAYEDVVVEELGATTTLRRTSITHNPAEGDRPAMDMLIVDYWLAVPGTQRVVLLTFSTPFVTMRAELSEMFRAMVALVRWVEPRVTA